MSRPMLKIAFVDGGETYENLTKRVLKDDFEVVSTFDNPDLCIFNFYKNQNHRRFNCKKLEITGENAYPHFEFADYSITCHHIDFENRHCRIPFYVFNKEYSILLDEKIEYMDSMFEREFCSALVSNSFIANPFRANFLTELNSRRTICSAGSVCKNANITLPPRSDNAENQNCKYTNGHKLQFISNFKFNIAMENSSVNGYVTEKITDAFMARTVPIYWGADDVTDEFNEDSFIRVDSNASFDENFNKIVSVCDDKDKYMSMLTADKLKKKDYLEVYRRFLLNVLDGKTFEHRYGNIGLK